MPPARDLPPPSPYSAVDANNVDLTTATVHVTGAAISIGQQSDGGLSTSFYTTDLSNWRNSLQSTISTDNGTLYTVTVLGSSVRFTKSGSTFSPTDGQGGSLVYDGSSVYTYTSRDGFVAVYNTFSSYFTGATISTITYPNGVKLTFNGATVTNNLGYMLKFNNACSYFEPCNPANETATAINNAVDYCNPAASSCTGLTQSWPTVTHGYGSLIDAAGQYTYLITDGYYAWGYSRSTTPYTIERKVWYDYSSYGYIEDARNATTGTTNYSLTDSGDTRTVIATDGLGHVRVVTSKVSTGQVLTDTVDPSGLNLTTTLTYDSSNRLTRITHPEGNYTNYTTIPAETSLKNATSRNLVSGFRIS